MKSPMTAREETEQLRTLHAQCSQGAAIHSNDSLRCLKMSIVLPFQLIKGSENQTCPEMASFPVYFKDKLRNTFQFSQKEGLLRHHRLGEGAAEEGLHRRPREASLPRKECELRPPRPLFRQLFPSIFQVDHIHP